MHADPWLTRRAALHDMIRETHELPAIHPVHLYLEML